MAEGNLFFRSTALPILSSLNIETAPWKTLSSLCPVVPADEILLHVHDPVLKPIPG
jgi:hypothetical protein